jgi:hypothetical protein
MLLEERRAEATAAALAVLPPDPVEIVAPDADELATPPMELRERQRASLWVEAQGWLDLPEIEARVERLVRHSWRRALRREAVERYLGTLGSEPLERYYEAHRGRFGEPLRFHFRRLTVPIGPTGVAVMNALEDAASGRADVSLEDLASRHGGQVEDLGWLPADRLLAQYPATATRIQDLQAGGRVAPFQDEDRFVLFEAVDRREPEARPLAAVVESVRLAYLEDHGPDLYREWRGNELEAHDLALGESRFSAIREAMFPASVPAAPD